MKKFLTAMVLLASLNSIASSESLIFEKSTNSFVEYEIAFDLNKDLGRAWVAITEINTIDEEDHNFGRLNDEIKVRVEGLVFDKSTNEIVYTDENGTESICATYASKRGIFGYSRITTTGNCSIKKRYITKEYDDGFKISKEQNVQFFLNI